MPSDIRMFSFLVFTVLFVGCLANPVWLHYSYSPAVGTGSGNSFSTSANGRITAVRMWEVPNSYIAGIQLCYNDIWDEVVGRKFGEAHEITLFENEVITQVSGKYNVYIHQLIFTTSRGRFLMAGHPTQKSFNMFPTHEDAELCLLSGRQNDNGIKSVGAHWGMLYEGPATALNGHYSND